MIEVEEEMQMDYYKNPAAMRNTMAVPENLPALLRGEMKHSDQYECRIEPNSSVIDGEESIEAEFLDETIDENDIDDPEPIYSTQSNEDTQTDLVDCDLQPM